MAAEPAVGIEITRPPRRRFQFRLRTLFIAVTVVAGICGFAMQRNENQRLVRALEEAAQREEEMKKEYVAALQVLLDRQTALREYEAELFERERSRWGDAPEIDPPPKAMTAAKP